MGRKTFSMTIVRGSTFRKTMAYRDEETNQVIDISGYKARMQIRTLAGRQGVTTAETFIMDLNTENGKLSINGSAGLITLEISSIDTVSLSPGNVKKRYVYDMELLDDRVSPAFVIPFMTGRITVKPEITR